MRAHEIHDPTKNVRRFAASESDARIVRQCMHEESGTKKLTITIQPVEIPTDKVGLLQFLNNLMR